MAPSGWESGAFPGPALGMSPRTRPLAPSCGVRLLSRTEKLNNKQGRPFLVVIKARHWTRKLESDGDLHPKPDVSEEFEPKPK